MLLFPNSIAWAVLITCANSKLMIFYSHLSSIMVRILRELHKTHKARFSLQRSLLIWVGMAVPLHQGGKSPIIAKQFSIGRACSIIISTLTQFTLTKLFLVHEKSSFLNSSFQFIICSLLMYIEPVYLHMSGVWTAPHHCTPLLLLLLLTDWNSYKL